jgi:hypothetical protein
MAGSHPASGGRVPVREGHFIPAGRGDFGVLDLAAVRGRRRS